MVLVKHQFKEDREIEKELNGFQRFMGKPKLIRRWISRAEFEVLREEVVRLRRIVDEHETIINDIDERNAFIVAQIRKMELTPNLKAISDKNIKFLREKFGLPPISEKIKEGVLAEMKGILKEFSEEEIDSVELLHFIRGEKR